MSDLLSIMAERSYRLAHRIAYVLAISDMRPGPSGWIDHERVETFWRAYRDLLGQERLHSFTNISPKDSERDASFEDNTAFLCAQFRSPDYGDWTGDEVQKLTALGYIFYQVWTPNDTEIERRIGSLFIESEDLRKAIEDDGRQRRRSRATDYRPNFVNFDDLRQIAAAENAERTKDDPLWGLPLSIRQSLEYVADKARDLNRSPVAIEWGCSRDQSFFQETEAGIHYELMRLAYSFQPEDSKASFEDYVYFNSVEKGHFFLENDNANEESRKELLRSVFEKIASLPNGEIERLAASVAKRVEKWSNDVPMIAPEFFQDRPASENLPTFLKRVYGERGYLNGILTTAHIDILDPACGTAIRNWIKHQGELPKDVNLPNKIERERGGATRHARSRRPG